MPIIFKLPDAWRYASVSFKLSDAWRYASVSRGSRHLQAKTVAGVSIGSAVLEKFLGAKSTTLSDAVSGDTATTNAVITFAAYATSIVSGEAFGATETAAALWIASAVLKLKDAGIDADSIKDNAVNIIIATVMGVIAFAE